jgi:signal transduction histidine kinase
MMRRKPGILRLVAHLSTAAREIAAGRYEVRAPEGDGPPEIRRLAQAFNAMADRLVGMVRTQNAFVSDASHQLRGPLTALLLRLENLEAKVPQDTRADLDATIEEGRRLSRIVDDLLTLARAERRSQAPGAVDVAKTCRKQAQAWQAKAAARSVVIEVEQQRGPQLAICGPDVLPQVLDVLLDNALDFTPPGERVRILIRPEPDTIVLHVVDAGPGMDEQSKAHAKDRFWRGEGSASRDGSGLGLAIADALLTANHGSLALADAVPRGLDARITLLRPVQERPARPHWSSPRRLAPPRARTARGAGYRPLLDELLTDRSTGA